MLPQKVKASLDCELAYGASDLAVDLVIVDEDDSAIRQVR